MDVDETHQSAKLYAAAPPYPRECQSTRGEWGEICPDCGQRLPQALPWDHGRPCAKLPAPGMSIWTLGR